MKKKNEKTTSLMVVMMVHGEARHRRRESGGFRLLMLMLMLMMMMTTMTILSLSLSRAFGFSLSGIAWVPRCDAWLPGSVTRGTTWFLSSLSILFISSLVLGHMPSLFIFLFTTCQPTAPDM